MELNQLKQEAGNNSEQYQAGIVNNFMIGITEERARVIIDEKLQTAIRDLTFEAKIVAEERAIKFAEELVPRLLQENLLNALREPRIQVALVEAQKQAVCTENKLDYQLLTELLINRTREIDHRNRYLDSSIEYASKMVNKITDESLLALTVLYAAEITRVGHGGIKDGMEKFSKMISNVLIGQLPKGDEWIDHLLMLGAISIAIIIPRKPFKEMMLENYNGYVAVGIKRGTEKYHKAISLLDDCGISNKALITHELRPDYVRLALPYADAPKIVVTGEDYLMCDITNPARKEAINQVHALYDDDARLKKENGEAFIALCNTYNSLRVVKEWWDSIPVHTRLTPAGIELARANALSYDKSFPKKTD